jgi:hypothetical protein
MVRILDREAKEGNVFPFICLPGNPRKQQLAILEITTIK